MGLPPGNKCSLLFLMPYSGHEVVTSQAMRELNFAPLNCRLDIKRGLEDKLRTMLLHALPGKDEVAICDSRHGLRLAQRIDIIQGGSNLYLLMCVDVCIASSEHSIVSRLPRLHRVHRITR